jgi:membrane-associated phospholipid phosphatase
MASRSAVARRALGARLGGVRGPWLRRAAVFGAPACYLVALTVVTVSWGLPVARDQLFIWLVAGIAAFSVPAWRGWGRLLLEWLPFFGLLAAYDYLRGAVAVTAAQAHVIPQIDFDKALFGGHVPSVWLQDRLWDAARLHWYDYAAWGVYMTHFFAVWVTAAVLWRRARHRFRQYAVTAVLLSLSAFATYWAYPAQPPWLAGDDGLIPHVDRVVPAVWGHLGVQTAESTYENSGFVNTVAAMPSLHAAFPVMLLLFFWSAGRWVRLGLGLYALAMGFTLVYGGEHFVADIVAGWAMALGVYALVSFVAARGARRAVGQAT